MSNFWRGWSLVQGSFTSVDGVEKDGHFNSPSHTLSFQLHATATYENLVTNRPPIGWQFNKNLHRDITLYDGTPLRWLIPNGYYVTDVRFDGTLIAANGQSMASVMVVVKPTFDGPTTGQVGVELDNDTLYISPEIAGVQVWQQDFGNLMPLPNIYPLLYQGCAAGRPLGYLSGTSYDGIEHYVRKDSDDQLIYSQVPLMKISAAGGGTNTARNAVGGQGRLATWHEWGYWLSDANPRRIGLIPPASPYTRQIHSRHLDHEFLVLVLKIYTLASPDELPKYADWRGVLYSDDPQVLPLPESVMLNSKVAAVNAVLPLAGVQQAGFAEAENAWGGYWRAREYTLTPVITSEGLRIQVMRELESVPLGLTDILGQRMVFDASERLYWDETARP